MEIEFNGKIIFWRGPSPFHFVAVPAKESREIKAVMTYAGQNLLPRITRIIANFLYNSRELAKFAAWSEGFA